MNQTARLARAAATELRAVGALGSREIVVTQCETDGIHRRGEGAAVLTTAFVVAEGEAAAASRRKKSGAPAARTPAARREHLPTESNRMEYKSDMMGRDLTKESDTKKSCFRDEAAARNQPEVARKQRLSQHISGDIETVTIYMLVGTKNMLSELQRGLRQLSESAYVDQNSAHTINSSTLLLLDGGGGRYDTKLGCLSHC
jgi:hypothetical protein